MNEPIEPEHEQLVRCLCVAFNRKPAEAKRALQDLLQQYCLNGFRQSILSSASAQVSQNEWNDAQQQLAEAERRGIAVLGYFEPAYPAKLRTIAAPPLVLFVRGKLPEGRAFGIVGSRRASAFGKSFSRSIAHTLSSCGVNIISGLALGIDAAAHRGAIDGGRGFGAAVLGSGVCNIYPRQHAALADELITAGGAVISEYGLDAPPRDIFFPQRNRIISGLSKAILVVEAQERSGALITARVAAEQGRDVFAVPGGITNELAAGTNYLIKSGAQVFTEIQDLWTFFPELCTASESESSSEDSSPNAYGPILKLLDRQEEKDFDTLIDSSGLTAPELTRVLTELELKGLITALPGGLYVRS